MKINTLLGSLFLTFFTPLSQAGTQPIASISQQEARDIAEDAYVYFYPLVTMDVTRKVMTNIEAGKVHGRGPMNWFHHLRTFPSATDKDVVRPNFDTLYSVAWLDLTRGPVIVSTPNTEGRYYLMPMMDMWSDVFAAPGKRTTGTQAAQYAVTTADWEGNLPFGVQRIDAPTPYVWIIGRIQTNGAQDFASVNSVQDGFKVTPLTSWGQDVAMPEATLDPTINMTTSPLDQVDQMPALDYFRYAAELMKLNKPHITDQTLLFQLKRIGIVPGQSLDINSPVIQLALKQGAADGLKKMKAQASKIAETVNGWQTNREVMGVYGNFYLKRAIIAAMGLGANLPEDSVYPFAATDDKGQRLDGQYNYVLHFNKDELPPVDGFWSVTMYDEQGFQVANPLNRFALGDRDPLRYNSDGSLDIYIQNENPGPERESNWLPAPRGILGITMRLYAPKESVLTGIWNPPAIRRGN